MLCNIPEYIQSEREVRATSLQDLPGTSLIGKGSNSGPTGKRTVAARGNGLTCITKVCHMIFSVHRPPIAPNLSSFLISRQRIKHVI